MGYINYGFCAQRRKVTVAVSIQFVIFFFCQAYSLLFFPLIFVWFIGNHQELLPDAGSEQQRLSTTIFDYGRTWVPYGCQLKGEVLISLQCWFNFLNNFGYQTCKTIKLGVIFCVCSS